MSSQNVEEYRYPHSRVSLPVLPNSAFTPPALQDLGDSQIVGSALADAVGLSAEPASATADPTGDAATASQSAPNNFIEQKLLEGKVIEALREIFDPEIPVNIYELGLIYDIKVDPENNVHIKMTLTAPACPVAGSLPGDVERRVEAIPEVKNADVELVWEPPWSRELMSEAAMLQLGMF
ncbi:MAG TPA: SUF system Fe-S cluster assembly protein [Humisphaera sp.]|jgi:FeS assembly SUF system protein|nr:SUF system Fe-S cluster assembly protein [Humisphaera sp.]